MTEVLFGLVAVLVIFGGLVGGLHGALWLHRCWRVDLEVARFADQLARWDGRVP